MLLTREGNSNKYKERKIQNVDCECYCFGTCTYLFGNHLRMCCKIREKDSFVAFPD